MHLHAAMVRRTGWRSELSLFLAVYIAYNLARWLFVGELERHACTRAGSSSWSSRRAWRSNAPDSPAAARLLSSSYLAAQFVVLPGALIWLYRRAPHDEHAVRVRRRVRSRTPRFAASSVADRRI